MAIVSESSKKRDGGVGVRNTGNVCLKRCQTARLSCGWDEAA